MARAARSRSPHGQSEWISRSIVTFGRYPNKCPPGLHVDGTGTLKLSALMAAWGQKHNLSEQEVLGALQKHMFHESGHKGSGGLLRFTIGIDPLGNTTIRVHKRRSEGGRWTTDDRPWSSGVATPMRAMMGARNTSIPTATSNSDSWQQSKSWQTNNSWQRDNSWQQCGRDTWQQEDKWQHNHAWPQKDARSQKDAWPQKNARSQKDAWPQKDARSQKDAWPQNAHEQWKRGDKIQRWLGYLLTKGSKEFGVSMQQGGWADLEEILDIMARKKPDFNINNETQLRELLKETDTAGRFEVNEEGCIRKVARNERQPQTSAASQGACSSHQVETAMRKAPPSPPGEHWTKYHDEGTLWYFYDGPLGKWWCQDASQEPQPFEDDGDEEE